MAAEPLPSTGSSPVTERKCDTADLYMIHRFIRMLFRDAVDIVERVTDGDRRQVTRVAAHLTDIAHVLHTHHHGEDIVIWDDLAERAPACALHVSQMRRQHAEISEQLEDLEMLVAGWRGSARRADAVYVLDALRRLNGTLDRHLGQEEDQILPVAAVSFTQAEWGRLERHGRRAVPLRWMFMQLGFMLDSMPSDEAGAFMGALPAPVRILWSGYGRGHYLRTRARLYGSATTHPRKDTAQ